MCAFTERAPRPTAYLEVEIKAGSGVTKEKYQLDKEDMCVGRLTPSDIIINNECISRAHIQITRDSHNNFLLVHPHPSRPSTKNGLIYQEQRIRGNETFCHQLSHGDIFHIHGVNGTRITITFLEDYDLPSVPLPGILPLNLSHVPITIGRFTDNKMVLKHPQVSGHHARLEKMYQDYYILDLASTNCTYVNGRRVSRCQLKPEDEIRIGPFKLIFTGTQLVPYDESANIRIDAFGLKKIGKKHAILLNNISLPIPPRTFVALVGASGTGKSTLLAALNGLNPAQEGVVLYNGQDYYHSIEAFSSQIGYVPQDDIVHADLSVEHALFYAAKLRLPNDFTSQQIEDRITDVLNDVELAHRRKMRISKLSGGQRKRVSIALELLAKPSVFFLDEPTSGLDPGLDRKMMRLLRNLANRGHTILLVTHATNNIDTCDFICFLAEGGRLAYFGPPAEAKRFFQTSDFADIYTALDSSNDASVAIQAEENFQKSSDYHKYVVEPLIVSNEKNKPHQHPAHVTLTKRSDPFRQWLLLSLRYLELLKNDTGNLLILLLQAPVIAGLLLLFISYGIGTGGFNSSNVIQCPTTAQVLTTSGFPAVPDPNHPIASKSCDFVEHFLRTNLQGKVFAAHNGGPQQALQDFILPGPGDAPKLLFILAFAAIMFGSINAAREIVKERAIYRRERAVNLGVMSYMFSKIAVLGALCLLQSLILVVMINWVDPFQHGTFLPGVVEVYITLALTSLAGLMMGLALSAIVPNTDRAMSFVPILLLPQVIFSGTLFPLKTWFLQVPGALFPIRWSMAALGSSVGLHSEKLGGDKLFGGNYTYHSTLFSTYSQSNATHYLLFMWFALVVMIVTFGFVMSYSLKRMYNNGR